MKKILLLFLLILTFQSFQKFSSNNNSKPKKETYSSLKKYIEKNNLQIDLEKSLFLKNKSDFNTIASYKSFNFYKKDINKFSIPDVFLFNDNLILIDENALGGCIIDRPKFVDSEYYEEIFKENKIILHQSEKNECSLELLSKSLCDYKGNPVFPFEKNKKILLFVWAKNKSSFNSLNDYINYTMNTLEKSKLEIDVYFLNTDEYSYL